MHDKKKGSHIWVGILSQPDEIQGLIQLYEKEGGNEYDNAAVIVGPTLSFEECVQLEKVFDFVVKLGHHQSPEEFNLLLWDHVTLRMGCKKNGFTPPHLTNGHVTRIIPHENEPIAIVGVSCRLPGANDTSQFWDNLLNSTDSLCPPPPGRWRMDQGCLNLTPEHKETKAGFLSCPVDTFDPEFWGISPLELSYTDPQARMLLQLGWEALENAGIPPSTLHGTTASIFIGLWRDEYKDLLVGTGSKAGGEELRRYLGCSMGNAAARIAHALGTTGPAYSIETGCSSSICSIGQAMAALRDGKTRLALAGGANLLLKPFVYPDFQGVLSTSGRCKVFQSDADGFARAEGAIFYVLKRESDAIKDGNHIYALLRGYGSSQEGLSRSVGTPTIEGEARAMTAALHDAGVIPNAVDWVEMHGTGTKVGDPIEIASTRAAYLITKENKQPLIITSVKANIGHTESVSGAAGLLKVILAMENGVIPAQLIRSDLNPKLNLTGMEIPRDVTPWTGTMAGVSSFGITGTNAHLIVQRGPQKNHQKTDSIIPAYILPLSAKCPDALADLRKQHIQALKNLDDSLLGSYCYTSSITRTHFTSPFRTAVVASSREEMIEVLMSDNTFEPELPTSSSPPTICFLFPGQGCQYTGMGRYLYESCSLFRRHFDIVHSLLYTKYDIDLKTLLFHGTEVSLYSQLCIFGVEYSLLKVWAGWGVTPSIVLGHSFGELAGSCAAGALSLPIALELLVAMRTKLFGKVQPGRMLVLKANEFETAQLIEEFYEKQNNDNNWIDIAGINAPEQTVVSGNPDNISAFSIFLTSVGMKNTAVAGVCHAFHSRALEPIGPQFEREAGTLSYSTRFPSVAYISSVEGRLLEEDEVMEASYWRKHMRQPVQFTSAAKAAVEVGGRLFIEVGPHPLLSPLVSKNAPQQDGMKLVCVPSMRKGAPELTTLLEGVASVYVNGVDLDWNAVWKSLGRFTQLRGGMIPTYPFQCKEVFWFTPEDDGGVKIEDRVGTVLHPLLGTGMDTPLRDTTIFTTSTRGLLKRAGAWLRDHKLGPHVIFPAAGYVEMAYAAIAEVIGAEFKAGNSCLELTSFEIKAALPLEVDAELQTILEEDENGGKFKVSFFSRKMGADELEATGNWKLHAQTKAIVDNVQFDDDIKYNGDKLEETTDNSPYLEMARYGYNFGPSFQTLDKMQTNELIEINCEISPKPHESEYYLHPTIIDALIQAALLSEELTGLKLPTKIESFKLRPGLQINDHFRISANSTGAQLYSYTSDSSNQTKVASLTSLTTVTTTLSIFQRASGLVTEPELLPLYVEEWKETHPLREFIPLSVTNLSSIIANNVVPFSLGVQEANEMDLIENYVCRSVVSAFAELGWSWVVGSFVHETEVPTHLGIPASVDARFIARLLHYAELAGFLFYSEDTEEWEVIRDFSEVPIPHEPVNPTLLQAEWTFATFYCSKLASLLSSSCSDSILPHLFPSSHLHTPYSADTLYSTFTASFGLLSNITSVFATLTRTYKGRHLRILEVGAGTGCATRQILQLLSGLSSTCYTFTDLSPSFLTRAEMCLPTVPGVELDFRVFDLEKDPQAQGFIRGTYDAIVALNVLHATINVEEVCSNLRTLLRPGGHLVVAEQYTPSALVDIVFGHCEGYWRFKDCHRSDHCLLGKEEWEHLLRCAGFSDTICVESKDIGMGVVVAENKRRGVENWVMVGDNGFAKHLEESLGKGGIRVGLEVPLPLEGGQQFIFVVPDNYDNECDVQEYRLILTSFLTLAQTIKKGKLLLVTHGISPFKDGEASFPLAGPILGMARTLANECPEVEVKWVDLDPLEAENSRILQILGELEEDRKGETFISYRNGIRSIAKLVPLETSAPGLSLPEGRVQLKLPESRSVADVEWISLPGRRRSLTPNEIEVRLLASGLNFKDLLNIMKPTLEFLSSSSVGADFCGQIISVGSSVTSLSVGDSVLGMLPTSAQLPNHVTVDASLVARLPDNLTHTEGATLPTAFLTAYHCLVSVGHLSQGQWVLIHTASGAVGLSGIQVARAVGANIICTAGSRRKRAYLKSLGCAHVYNSRDLSYAQGVMKATSGTGVDIVLNSLTSKGWKEASLSVTRKGGKFIEMSKLNIWRAEEVALLRPDITYSVEDLSIPDFERGRHLTQVMNDWLADGRLKPIRHTVFLPTNISTALRQLERALHIGKVVIGWNSTLFNERSTYLITGGSGALGQEVARWILQSGGKHVVLASRISGRGIEVVRRLKAEHGLDVSGVVVMEADVGDKAQVNQLIASISKDLPPLRGIFHAAGVLSDGTLPTQTMTKMEKVFSGKVDGAWALHTATQHLPLEHFVLFSSAMWLLGGPGQVNYTAANAALSSLAEYRYRLGLPATSIAWGHWGEVGMAAETGRRIFGVEPFSTERGLRTLEHLLRNQGNNSPTVMAAELCREDINTGWLKDYVQIAEEHTDDGTRQKSEFMETAIDGVETSLEDKVRNVLGRILRVKGTLDGKRELRAMGMDSLMFIELKNRLQANVGVILEVPDTTTVDELVGMVTKAKANLS